MVWYFYSLQVQSCNDYCYAVMMFNQVIMFSCYSLLYEIYLWKFQLGSEENYGLNL